MYTICHMATRILISMYSIQFYYSIRFSSFDLFRILVGAMNSANHPKKGLAVYEIVYCIRISVPLLVYDSPLIQFSPYTFLRSTKKLAQLLYLSLSFPVVQTDEPGHSHTMSTAISPDRTSTKGQVQVQHPYLTSARPA